MPVRLDPALPRRGDRDGRHCLRLPRRIHLGAPADNPADARRTVVPCVRRHQLWHRHSLGVPRRLQLRGDDTLAIFGQGPVGLAATQLASAMGARVIALDISEPRLARSCDVGAWETLNPSAVILVADAVRDLTGGRGVSKSLETSDASSAARDALHVLDLWGVACWVGVGSTIHFDLTEHLYKQITGLPSWTLSIPAMADCARFVVDRGIDVDALFTERWKLDEADQAYQLLDKQSSGKGVFIP